MSLISHAASHYNPLKGPSNNKYMNLFHAINGTPSSLPEKPSGNGNGIETAVLEHPADVDEGRHVLGCKRRMDDVYREQVEAAGNPQMIEQFNTQPGPDVHNKVSPIKVFSGIGQSDGGTCIDTDVGIDGFSRQNVEIRNCQGADAMAESIHTVRANLVIEPCAVFKMAATVPPFKESIDIVQFIPPAAPIAPTYRCIPRTHFKLILLDNLSKKAKRHQGQYKNCK